MAFVNATAPREGEELLIINNLEAEPTGGINNLTNIDLSPSRKTGGIPLGYQNVHGGPKATSYDQNRSNIASEERSIDKGCPNSPWYMS